jgi:hypothetical protein
MGPLLLKDCSQGIVSDELRGSHASFVIQPNCHYLVIANTIYVILKPGAYLTTHKNHMMNWHDNSSSK